MEYRYHRYVYMTSNSSFTLQGSGGFVTSVSSINASAFFGDGSHLSGSIGNVVLAASQTFSGANTFTSSFTVTSQGRQIILSTSATANNMSISSGGIISFFPELHNSSAAFIPQVTTTNQYLGPCVAGSTLTITTSGGRVEVLFTGTVGNGGGNGTSNFKATFLQDGLFVGNQGPSGGITFNFNGGGNPSGGGKGSQGGFSYLLDAPSPGAHSYCFTMGVVLASGFSITLFNDSAHANIFYVKEIK